MRVLVVISPIILAATPVLAQSSGSDAAAAGGAALAGLVGVFGLFWFFVALVYSVVFFFLPFMVWKCLRRLTSIRDDIRGFRQEITALAARMSAAPPLPATPGQYHVNDVSNLQRLVKENEKNV
jgi:hypothetical protein